MDDSIFSLNFQPITIQSQEVVEPYLKKYPHDLSGYTFSLLLIGNAGYEYKWAFLDDETLLILACSPDSSVCHLLEPIGSFPLLSQKNLLFLLSNNPLKLVWISINFIKKNSDFCTNFEIKKERNRFNYLYRASDLSNLSGGDYEKKRNLIAQAEKLYDLVSEPMDEKCHPHCPKILENVGRPAKLSLSLENELKALNKALFYYKPLKLKGKVISDDGQPIAFSIYQELNKKTAEIIFEKADKHYKGLYQLINRETAKTILEEGYELINRQEDLGLEGLRQAKLSYHPVELTPCYSLILK